MPRYFHTTDAADAIITSGFRDGTGSYLFGGGFTLTGVFLADQPVGVDEGAIGDQVLAVDLPDRLDIDEFEIVEEGKTYREWCIPAALINEHAEVTLLRESERDEEIVSRFTRP